MPAQLKKKGKPDSGCTALRWYLQENLEEANLSPWCYELATSDNRRSGLTASTSLRTLVKGRNLSRGRATTRLRRAHHHHRRSRNLPRTTPCEQGRRANPIPQRPRENLLLMATASRGGLAATSARPARAPCCDARRARLFVHGQVFLPSSLSPSMYQEQKGSTAVSPHDSLVFMRLRERWGRREAIGTDTVRCTTRCLPRHARRDVAKGGGHGRTYLKW